MPPETAAVELLDVVDATNRVIGRASRAQVHRRRWRHRAVHILILNSAGEVFVQRRAAHKDCAPGLWDTSAAGHVDAGESVDRAAARELHEELGLDDVALERIWTLPAGPLTGNEFVTVYRGVTGREPQPDAHEIAASGWFEPAALNRWMGASPADFTGTFRAIAAYRRARPVRHP